MLEMQLVTGKHCISSIQQELDKHLRDEDHFYSTNAYHINFEFEYKDTWEGEMYILYDSTKPLGFARHVSIEQIK